MCTGSRLPVPVRPKVDFDPHVTETVIETQFQPIPVPLSKQHMAFYGAKQTHSAAAFRLRRWFRMAATRLAASPRGRPRCACGFVA